MKNCRNAVAAVIVREMLAAMYCQNVSHMESMDEVDPWVRMPAMRRIVQRIVKIVRHKEHAMASFCVHRIFMDQIRRQGMKMTAMVSTDIQ